MANANVGPSVEAEDLLPVKSRVSWGAIFAGAVLALALAFLFSLLGGAVGLSIRHRVNDNAFNTAAAIWAVLSTVVSLFVGGWAATKLAVGENKTEAGIYGLLLWGTTFAMLLGLMGMGVNSAFGSLATLAGAGRVAQVDSAETPVGRFTADRDWEARAREAGVEQAQIDKIKENARQATRAAADLATDPATQDAALSRLTQASWWTFAGTLLSMVAAVGGSMVGSGPSFRIVAVPVRRTVTTDTRMPVRN